MGFRTFETCSVRSSKTNTSRNDLVYVKRGTHPEPTGTCRNHPEPLGTTQNLPGSYPEPPGTFTGIQNNKNEIKLIKKQNENNKTKKNEMKISSFHLKKIRMAGEAKEAISSEKMDLKVTTLKNYISQFHQNRGNSLS